MSFARGWALRVRSRWHTRDGEMWGGRTMASLSGFSFKSPFFCLSALSSVHLKQEHAVRSVFNGLKPIQKAPIPF